ncbi:hypothetical protein RIF29_40398 [Crotalaria pallida]|uniref:DUF641 domain-containing protein n=1 Tax=Crotalaria pallida TaxID=3830 RepID=A0AAN9HQM9_CROPI
MESIIKPKPAINNRSSKLTKTFQKLISLQTATKKIASNNDTTEVACTQKLKIHQANDEDLKARQRAIMEALIARLFAGVTTVKASYAELQIAHHPYYNNEAIQKADQAVVDELRAISELKQSFLKKELIINFSPQVTLLLAEIQEQQSLMKTYQITMKKLEAQVDAKESEISSLKNKLYECVAFNKSLEKKLHYSKGSSNLHFSSLNPTHFKNFLNHTLRSLRYFVKLLMREMESAHWDLEAAVRSIHHHDALVLSSKPSHQCFAFESFICMKMFEGFNYPSFYTSNSLFEKQNHFENFKKLKSFNTKRYLEQNANSSSSFGRFLKSKYHEVVHAKMECSLFGNLNQRKLLDGGGVPDSAFFMAFAEMAKRVWCLHHMTMSFEKEEVTIFQVEKKSRFSEVYMECVAEEELVLTTGEGADDSGSGELRVGFTVVPGFIIGKTVIQSQVYLSQASC